MPVPFDKYHGIGNDFLVVDLRRGGDFAWLVESPEAVRAVCRRRFGVGADGVLTVEAPTSPGAHARMRVLNADGSEAEMCGNGIRCVVKHLYENDPSMRLDALTIDTGAGPLECAVVVSDARVRAVTVDMGRPRMERGEIPMTGPASERCQEVVLPGLERELPVTCVSMGNPHAVAFVDETGDALRELAEALGPRAERHEWFPRRTNCELARIASEDDIELVVWERGVGITLACGTGACATVVAACLTGRARTDADVTVHLPGGDLVVRVAEDYSRVLMTGAAEHVFSGSLSPIPSR